tara:strand:+ start:40 stop:294 length:255 start_codon:yes stop_codon:yes gene_type:complete
MNKDLTIRNSTDMLKSSNFLFTSETTPDVLTDLSGCASKVDKLINIADAYAYTSKVKTQNSLLDDAKEGISSFLEKRKPIWKEH